MIGNDVELNHLSLDEYLELGQLSNSHRFDARKPSCNASRRQRWSDTVHTRWVIIYLFTYQFVVNSFYRRGSGLLR